MEFRNLEHTDFDTLFEAFGRAFSDYEIHFNKEELHSMLIRRGYTPSLSFAAFDKGEIVSFTLNGIGMFNGILSAYDTGTGTVKEYRGQGLASRLFSHALPYLKEANIRQYLLEVLQNNTGAIAVYRRMNFTTTREFDCFRQDIVKIPAPKAIAVDCRIESVDVDFVRQAQSFCDFCPSWQNSIESIERGKSGLVFLGAEIDSNPAGFCVFDPLSGDLTQIAVKNEFRKKGVASLLLHRAVKSMKTNFVKVLNVSSDNLTLPSFLSSYNITLASRQFEMILNKF